MKPSAPQVTVIDRYVPDYDTKCTVCGASPTVTAVSGPRVVYRGELCGPCTWGEADALDPATWNA